VVALLDDHLLRDLLARSLSTELAQALDENEPATTNLYLYRLSRSIESARGGALTGSWPIEVRRALGRSLVTLPPHVHVVPMQALAYRMAEIAAAHRVSTLGAEAAAAAEHLGAALYVWEGDDGPGIRSAVGSVGAPYRTVAR
jgi:cell wall-associated NlpC family hydrolase